MEMPYLPSDLRLIAHSEELLAPERQESLNFEDYAQMDLHDKIYGSL